MQEKFKHNDHYDERSLPNMQVLLGLIEADLAMTDIRWLAYMLATALWETSHIETFQVPKTGKGGKVVAGKDGKVITRARKVWINMKPVHETGEGAGRRYHNPVKVQSLRTGELKITEWNGNVFTVKTNGQNTAAVHGRVPGANPPSTPVAAYHSAAGDEHAYFGRGYVQLTWWYNYATAGVLLDKGLTLVTDPENAMVAETAAGDQTAVHGAAFNERPDPVADKACRSDGCSRRSRATACAMCCVPCRRRIRRVRARRSPSSRARAGT